MSDRLAVIEARVNAATEGPWTTDGEIHSHDEFWMQYVEVEAQPAGSWGFPIPAKAADDAEAQSNADFIAHAREDVPWLVGRVRDLEDALTQIADVQRHKRKPADWRCGFEIARAALAGARRIA